MRPGILAYLAHRFALDPEPAATLALAYVLGASEEVAKDFAAKMLLRPWPRDIRAGEGQARDPDSDREDP